MNRATTTLLIAALFAAALATGLTIPASADYRSVTVRMADGSMRAYVIDVPTGATLQDIRTLVPGEPVSWAPAQPPSKSVGEPGQPALPDSPTVPTPKDLAPGDRGTTGGLQPAHPRGKKGKGPRRTRRHAVQHAPKREVQVQQAKPRPKQAKPGPGPSRGPLQGPGGVPTPRAPGFMDSLPGAGTTKVPNFVINKFRVPIFLLPIYQAAGTQYGVRWEILAAINEIETDYGRNLNVSSAGALGWMQFMPATWKTYGVDANRDGKKDPYNPVDAIFAAARYLKAAGYGKSVRGSILAYNHADWYADSVMLRARLIAGVPADLVGSLTGLTEGRFPVAARARYADNLRKGDAGKRVKPGQNAADVVHTDDSRQGIDVYARRGAPAVATTDGVIKKLGTSKRLGHYVTLQDAYGNRFTYGHLGGTARVYPAPKEDALDPKLSARALRAHHDKADPRPSRAASGGRQVSRFKRGSKHRKGRHATARPVESPEPKALDPVKERLFAHPDLPQARKDGGMEQSLEAGAGHKGLETYDNRYARPVRLDPKRFKLRRMRKGAHVIGGTVLGRIGRGKASTAPHLYFEIRPAGKGAPRVDPKPILDGWKLLEATAIYRASGKNALTTSGMSIGQILLMPKHLLERRVLADDRVDIYPCGRRDVTTGQIDRRVLATLEYLAESGMRPTVSALKCGHGFFTASGNVSEHSSGSAVDISEINGVSILNHQERGGITEQAVRRLMALQGTIRPHQIISLLDFGQNTLPLPDHANHIHVGFQPLFGENRRLGRTTRAALRPDQWPRLLKRLGDIKNPVVPTSPSRFAVPTRKLKNASKLR